MRRASVTTDQLEALCVRVDNCLHALGVLTPSQTLDVTRTTLENQPFFELLVVDARTHVASEAVPRVLRGHCLHENVIGYTKREAHTAMHAMAMTLLEVMEARTELTSLFTGTIIRLSQLDPDTCKLATVLIADGRDWTEAIEAAKIINKKAEHQAKTDWVRAHTTTFEVAQ
jgi:hypothetical protein